MRDTKRTPGPWHVERYVVDRSSGREVGAWERGSLIERRRVTAGDGMIVADLVAGGPADATLLAAAPLLAELAHRLVVSLQCSGVDAAEGSNDPLEALHHDAIEALRAAGVASPETAMAQAALAPAPSPAATPLDFTCSFCKTAHPGDQDCPTTPTPGFPNGRPAPPAATDTNHNGRNEEPTR